MNKLNLKSQGEKKLICDLARQVQEFMLKFKLFIIQNNNNFIRFSTWINIHKIPFILTLSKLAAKSMRRIKECFVDMDKFRVNFQLMQCPFEFNVDNTELLQELVDLLRCSFETDLF